MNETAYTFAYVCASIAAGGVACLAFAATAWVRWRWRLERESWEAARRNLELKREQMLADLEAKGIR